MPSPSDFASYRRSPLLSRNRLLSMVQPVKSWAYDSDDDFAAEMRERFERRGGLDKIGDLIGKSAEVGHRVGGVVAPLAAMYFGGPYGAALAGGGRAAATGGDWKDIGLGAGLGYLGGKYVGTGPGSVRAAAAGPSSTFGGLDAATGGGNMASAATIDPFLAGGGSGTWLPVAGGGMNAAAPWYKSTWGKKGIELGLGALFNKFLGGETGAEGDLRRYSDAPYEDVERFLPPQLRRGTTGPILESGMEGIAALLANPGGLSPGVADAIRPRLAAESETIGQNFRGIRSEQAGAAARGNLPVSIKGALQSALGVSEERAQRGARREALMDSEELRRKDLQQTYALLDALLQFTSSGRGQAIQGLGAASQQSGQRQAALMALIGSLLTSGS